MLCGVAGTCSGPSPMTRMLDGFRSLWMTQFCSRDSPHASERGRLLLLQLCTSMQRPLGAASFASRLHAYPAHTCSR